MNAENLLKVKALILEEPLRLDMETWKTTNPDYSDQMPKCGTVACIAGWGATLKVLETDKRIKKIKTAAGRFDSGKVENLGAEFFGLTPTQARDLFFESHWPQDLQDRLEEESSGTAAYAKIAAEAIDRFIACGGNWAKEMATGAAGL